MKIPVVESFCYCISLKTGVKIVGFTSIIGCFIAIFVTGLELILVMYFENEPKKSFLIEASIEILTEFIQVSSSIVLLLGVYQGKPQFFLPWLVTSVLIILVEVIFMRAIIVDFYFDPKFKGLTIEWIILALVSIVDNLYGMLIVLSYYSTLRPPQAAAV